jgi:hypothetical protein
LRRLALFALVIALAVPAAAQTPIGPSSEEPPPTVVHLKTTALIFTDSYIQGELTRPNDSYLHARGKTRFRNLIELRGNFRPELARSASKLP